MPLMMVGIPDDKFEMVLANSNTILSGADPEFLSEDLDEAVTRLLTAGQALAELMTDLAQAREGTDCGEDLESALVTANIDGERPTSAELGSFFILLVVAGNETTRTALSHALILLTQYPEQRAMLAADLGNQIEGAVEEIVRYASPVIFMRRTLTGDYTMNGQDYRKGDKVVLYWSANRDEAVFADPEQFDITRSPNPHVGYGAAGPHFCLGVHLARREIAVILRELLTGYPASWSANRTACCPASSTASSDCRASSQHREDSAVTTSAGAPRCCSSHRCNHGATMPFS